LEVELERRFREHGVGVSFREVFSDIKRVKAVHFEGKGAGGAAAGGEAIGGTFRQTLISRCQTWGWRTKDSKELIHH